MDVANMPRHLTQVWFFIALFVCSTTTVLAQSRPQGVVDTTLKQSKRASNYASIGITYNEFKDVPLDLVLSDSINVAEREDSLFESMSLGGHTYSLAGTYGWYLDDTFKTEWRFGKGIRSDNLREAYEIDINHWFAWYMGMQRKVSETIYGYVLLGLSTYEADVRRREIQVFNQGRQTVPELVYVQPSPFRMEKGMFSTSFSFSWMLGVDIPIAKDMLLTLEYGRLLKDSGTKIEVHQASTYLKFNF